MDLCIYLLGSDGLNSQRLPLSSLTLRCCESTSTAFYRQITYSFGPKVRPLRGRLILVHRRRPPLLLPFSFEVYQHLLGFFVVWTTLHWDGLKIVFTSVIVWQPSIFRWLNLAAIFVYLRSSLVFFILQRHVNPGDNCQVSRLSASVVRYPSFQEPQLPMYHDLFCSRLYAASFQKYIPSIIRVFVTAPLLVGQCQDNFGPHYWCDSGAPLQSTFSLFLFLFFSGQ